MTVFLTITVFPGTITGCATIRRVVTTLDVGKNGNPNPTWDETTVWLPGIIVDEYPPDEEVDTE